MKKQNKVGRKRGREFDRKFPKDAISETIHRMYPQLISRDEAKTFIHSIREVDRQSLVEEIEKMKKLNQNSIDKLPETCEQDRITNCLNENMVFGYQQALSDIIALIKGDER